MDFHLEKEDTIPLVIAEEETQQQFLDPGWYVCTSEIHLIQQEGFPCRGNAVTCAVYQHPISDKCHIAYKNQQPGCF